MRPKKKVNIAWSPALAYAIGLIATDGNLSKDKRHINFTSKDIDQVLCFKSCLCLSNSIGRKARGGELEKKYFVIQFGDVLFYKFLLDIGLTPAKSKTLGALIIPQQYFKDFLRGCIDGDGNINISRHPESTHPQLRLRIASASPPFLYWLRKEIKSNFGVQGGWIHHHIGAKAYDLTYGKADAIIIFKGIYYLGVEYFLKRKHAIAEKFMGE